LPARAKDGHEDLLRLRGHPGAIAAADLSIHDRRSQGLFGAPIRGLHRVVVQEAEERGPLAVKMGDKPSHGGNRAALVEDRAQARLEVATRHRPPMIRDSARGVPIPQGQRLLQDVVDLVREQRPGMIGLQFARASQEMLKTGLMRGPVELPIRCPPVPYEGAREVRAEQRRRLVEAAAGLYGVDGRARRDGDPQPLQLGAHAPAGFIGRDDGTLPNGVQERGIGRGRLTRRAMQRVDQPPRRHGQPEVLLIELRDFGKRQPAFLVQVRGRHNGLWAQLRRGGTDRIGGLQGMAALHALATLLTRADVNLKRTHEGAHGRQVFVILSGDAGLDHHACTRGTGPWQRSVILLIDVRRSRTPCAGAIGRARLPARTPWMRGGTISGKRGRLPLSRAPRRVQLPPQALVLST